MIFVIAAGVRLFDALHPIDHASWRESDIGSISRNFVREDMDPLMPRIDWRGDGPGFAEMELPAYPWLIAVSYKMFGINDILGRVINLLFSIGTLIFFYRLARKYLDGYGAVLAFAFFAFNPLVFESATSVQPEGLTMLAYVGAAYFFARWRQSDKDTDLAAAALFTALAILAKATAAHIGILFAITFIERYGWNVVKQLRVYAFAIVTLLPAAIWYIHAKGLWKTYGNSLGVSNEYHWIGLDFFTNSYFIKGIAANELFYVWTISGAVIALFGIITGFRQRTARYCVAWLASISLFLLIAARTTADDWASYYHIFAVAPAAILFGFGFQKIADLARRSADTFSDRLVVSNLIRFAFIALLAMIGISAYLIEARAVRAHIADMRKPDPSYTQAAAIKPRLTSQGLILSSGGKCVDDDGYALAYNVSFMFYWLDRKGWNICTQDQSLANVDAFAKKGAVYFVAQRSTIAQKTGFTEELRARFPVDAETDDFIVFGLTQDMISASR